MDPEIAVQNLLDLCDKPLIGLEHIEYLSSQKLLGRKGVGYKCNLCISTGMSEMDIITHVTGLTHRLAYLKKNHMDLYQSCMDGIHNDTKNLPFRVENMAQLVEKNFGRKRVYFSFGARRELREYYQPNMHHDGVGSGVESWESQLAQQQAGSTAQNEWLLRNVLLTQQPPPPPTTAPTSSESREARTSVEVVARAAREWAAAVEANSDGTMVGHLNVDVGGGRDHLSTDEIQCLRDYVEQVHIYNSPNGVFEISSGLIRFLNSHQNKSNSDSQSHYGNKKEITETLRCTDTKKMKRNAADLYVICFDNDGSYKPQDAPSIAKKYASCRHLSSVTISKRTVSLKFSDRESVKSAMRQAKGSSHEMYIHPDCIHREYKKDENRASKHQEKEKATSVPAIHSYPQNVAQSQMGTTLNEGVSLQGTQPTPALSMAQRYCEIRQKQLDFLKEFRSYLLCLKAAKQSANPNYANLFPVFDVDKIEKMKIFMEDTLKREQERDSV